MPVHGAPSPEPTTLLGIVADVWPWVVAGAALLLLLVVAAVVVWIVVRRRRRRRRRVAFAPRFPVVLAHGLMGFDEVGFGPVRRHYFKGATRSFSVTGCEVYRPRVAKAASIAQRAQQLADQVGRIRATRVTIVAHSMGGLDARYAINRLGLGKKVAALVTIGTPHLGTPIADVGTDLLGTRLGLRRAFRLAGVDTEAFYDLTSLRMEAFNREIEDVRGVEYVSIVGFVRDKLHCNPVLLPTYLYLLDKVGPNDGLVPAGSQRWGEVLQEIEADHFQQIGWGRGFAARDFYQGIIHELRARGF